MIRARAVHGDPRTAFRQVIEHDVSPVSLHAPPRISVSSAESSHPAPPTRLQSDFRLIASSKALNNFSPLNSCRIYIAIRRSCSSAMMAWQKSVSAQYSAPTYLEENLVRMPRRSIQDCTAHLHFSTSVSCKSSAGIPVSNTPQITNNIFSFLIFQFSSVNAVGAGHARDQ